MVSNGEDMKRLNPSPVYEPLLNTNGQLEAFSSCWCLNEGLSHRSLFFGSVMLHNERSRIINSKLFISVVLLLTTYQMSELFKSHFAVSFFAYRGLILMKLHAVEFNQNTNLRNRETCKRVERRFITSFSGCSGGKCQCQCSRQSVRYKMMGKFWEVFCLIYFITILYHN